MKYESAALLMLIVVNATMKKNDSMRKGRLRTSSFHRSLDFTVDVCSLSMAMRSLLSAKQKKNNPRPNKAKMLIVMNQAVPASGVLYTASIFPVWGLRTLGANMAITSGSVFMTRPPKLANSIRMVVRRVISSESRVIEDCSAPYGTLMRVKHMLIPTYVT